MLPKTGSDTAVFEYIILFLLFVLFFVICYLFSLSAAALKGASLSGIKSGSDDTDSNVERAVRIKNREKKHIVNLCAGAVFNASAAVFINSYMFCSLFGNFLYSKTENLLLSYYLPALIMLVLSDLLITMLGIVVPIRISERAPDRLLIKKSAFIQILSALFMPIGALCGAVSDIFLRRTTDSDEGENPTEEKILAIADEGEENGTIEENTRSMIENVFEFDDTTVGEIMTHRKDIVAVRDDDSLMKLTSLAIESGRSRIPVYHDDIDDIVGIIYVKDLLQYVGKIKTDEQIDKSMIRESVFVPESKRCSEMFEYMTSHKTQIAVVVDEFGGTGGIVTMEDLIESILGNIQDEYDNEDESIKKVNENSFTVDGATPLDEIEDLTGISFEGDPNDTLAGIMLDRMGHIPKTGEHPSIMINGTRFTVLEADQRRISKILIVKNHSK